MPSGKCHRRVWPETLGQSWCDSPNLPVQSTRAIERLQVQYKSHRRSLGGALTSTGFSRSFDTVWPLDVSPSDRRRLSEVMGICSSMDHGAHHTVAKDSKLSVGNRAFLFINPPPICEIRSAPLPPRNLREGHRVLASREPLFLVRTSALAKLSNPADEIP